MISVTCGQCQAHYELKDEVMGKKIRCSNCSNVFIAGQKQDAIQKTTPSEEVTIKIPDEKKENGSDTLHDRGIFSANIYGVKQKRIAVNEKYYIKDKDNKDVFFSVRRIHFWRSLGAILGAIILCFVVFIGIGAGFNVLFDEQSALIGIVLGFLVGLSVLIGTLIYLSPRRNIEFYYRESDMANSKPIFMIRQDNKIEFIVRNYTLRNEQGEIIATFRKNVFTNILRRKWHLYFQNKHFLIKEDSIILSLLRRFLPFGQYIRTNFIFLDVTTDPDSTTIVGIFKRKFELFDSYTLDMSSDPAFTLPRQHALCMAVLLDTGEKR